MSIYWNRLRYVLSPQFDVYEQLCRIVNGRVADIGSGTGFGSHLLIRNARRVDGYEIDDDAREFSQRCFSNGHIQFYRADITDARFVNEFRHAYDWVVMVDVIEHIEDDNAAVANCAKLLAPNGTFVCSTPNRLSRYRISDNHVREYEQNELHILLRSCFDRVQICNYKGDMAISEYENPIVAICKNEVIR